MDSGADAAPPAEPAPEFEVVYEDADLLVIDKPAGLVTHPARGHRGPTLAEALSGRVAGGPDPERAGIVHRLDRDTSGLLVVTKTEQAHAALAAQLRAREVRREYLALVAGRVDAESGTIDAPIGRDRGRRTVMSTRSDRPRNAVTHFETIERLPAHHAAARPAGDRSHAPDPRAPGRDRPSGLRRPPVRGHAVRPPLGSRAAISACDTSDV